MAPRHLRRRLPIPTPRMGCLDMDMDTNTIPLNSLISSIQGIQTPISNTRTDTGIHMLMGTVTATATDCPPLQCRHISHPIAHLRVREACHPPLELGRMPARVVAAVVGVMEVVQGHL